MSTSFPLFQIALVCFSFLWICFFPDVIFLEYYFTGWYKADGEPNEGVDSIGVEVDWNAGIAVFVTVGPKLNIQSRSIMKEVEVSPLF